MFPPAFAQHGELLLDPAFEAGRPAEQGADSGGGDGAARDEFGGGARQEPVGDDAAVVGQDPLPAAHHGESVGAPVQQPGADQALERRRERVRPRDRDPARVRVGE